MFVQVHDLFQHLNSNRKNRTLFAHHLRTVSEWEQFASLFTKLHSTEVLIIEKTILFLSIGGGLELDVRLNNTVFCGKIDGVIGAEFLRDRTP